MGERKGNEGKKVMNSLLAHPFLCENGLLSLKGWTGRPFSGGYSSQCEAQGLFHAFGPFWVHIGAFGALYAKS